MTLDEGISLVLDRVGLDSGNTSFKNRARKYLNLTAVEISNLLKWWWLDRTTTFKTTLTFVVSSASGTFTVGETVTGGTSGKTAIVDSHDTTNNQLFVYSESGTFTATETLTGGTSGVTATFVSSSTTRVYTPVDGAVTAWWSFVNETDEWPLEIVGPDEYDMSDEDRSLTGNVYKVFIGGVDTTTGYPTIELYYTPSDTNVTIRVRYQIAIAEWGASDDNKTFLTLGFPQIAESALVYGASKLYYEEKGDESGAQREAAEMARVVRLMMKANLAQQGNRRYPASDQPYAFIVRTDNSLVVEAG